MVEIKVQMDRAKSGYFTTIEEGTISIAWKFRHDTEENWRWILVACPLLAGESLHIAADQEGARVSGEICRKLKC